ncbi:uncharacterized protein LOC105850100 [Hydra vulgaris]|uniref:uncharacterized protein LOC105850100 n=1 Tax=Hydra vulgaris TaxID=6087 RepID=UPI001F5E829C|nr:uncharacterized protein LOC105850100 [Hydra vulgaris]XP_047131431.1 uncharacterized protein LOC105850100 [Hydra vulgaris]
MSQFFTNSEKNEIIVFSHEFKLELGESVGVDWRTLGRWLNIEENYLDKIDQNNVKTNVKMYSMLTKWEQINENPTLEELKSALRKMERMDLIGKIDELTMLKNKLNSDELISKCCGEISYKIGSDWSRWGRHLGLGDADLDNINSDHTKCFDKAENVLKKWKQINGYLSWDQLKKELIAFNRNDIIVEIEEKFKDHLPSLNKLRKKKKKKKNKKQNKRNETLNFDLSEQLKIKLKNENVVQSSVASNFIARVGYLISDRYNLFGRHLGLNDYDLRNINHDHASAQAKAVAVIDKWIESNGKQSWVQLKEKLITF